jgi:hypothetical protein
MYFVFVYSLNHFSKDTDLCYLQPSHASTSGASKVIAVCVVMLRISVRLCVVLENITSSGPVNGANRVPISISFGRDVYIVAE